MLDLALVGTGGMLPLPHRWLASVLVRHRGHLVLFDCGEGTQISLRSLGWGIKAIDLVLVSHLHGDHVGGLPGLLLTQGNSGRTEPVTIMGPPGLTRVVEGLRVIAPHLPFGVHCLEIEDAGSLELDGLRVSTARADHSVPCLAYRLDLPRSPRFQPERARALGVPVDHWGRLQRGETVLVDGKAVGPADVLGPARRGIGLGLVTDSRPTPELAALFREVALLVSEGTYGADEDQPRAVERKHMTFREAAELARAAGAGELLITHFSPSLVDPPTFADRATAVFPHTTVGYDHLTRTLAFPDD